MPRKSSPPDPLEVIDEFSQRVGQFIDEALKARNWDQQQLADAMGISQSMLSRLMRGRSKFTLEYLSSASKALKMPIAKLVYASLEEADQATQSDAALPMSARPARVPVGLNAWLGENGENVTPRERRWLESIEFAHEPETATAEFWNALLKAFRGR